MRRPASLALLLVALAACGSPDPAETPLFGDRPAAGLDLRAALAAAEVELLGPVEVTLDLFVADGVEASFAPTVPDGFAGEVHQSPTRPHAGGTWQRTRLVLRPTAVGERRIPPFTVRDATGAHTATTPELTLQVGSIVGEFGDAIEAPAPPFEPRARIRPWLLAAAAAALLALGVSWWRRRRPQPIAPVGTALPPHVKALRALARLRHAPRTTPAEVDAFYVEVSQVLRVYLEERFGLSAPERTTEEFLPEAERSGLFGVEQQLHLRQFLQQCDLVKFARALPATEVHDRSLEFVESFVDGTRPERQREEVA
jgi:hypothetical protein